MPQAFDFGKSTFGTDTFQYAGSVPPVPPHTGASITYIQDHHANSTNASIVTISSGTVTAGDFLVASICLPSTASVASITDNLTGRWIQTAYSYDSGGNSEIWTCRGSLGGALTVTVTLTALSTTGVNISEWANVWTAYPLDQWSQNFGTSAGPQVTQIQPRGEGELFIGVVSTQPITHIPPGYTALTESGSSGYSAAYKIMSGASVAISPIWTTGAASPWAVAAATFQPGPQNVNPHLQFPECFVQMSTTNNFLAPLQGIGVFTDISGYVRNMTLGPLGRQHELDRVQATTAQITCTNRIDGAFNPWNTSSFLYNGGLGLKPMNPIKVTAAWLGVTSPVFYGYLQAVDPVITDVLNVDAQITAVDILQMMSLKYLSNDNYAQLIESDGGANLQAYYRLGDMPGSYSVTDATGNYNTGSLISGVYGPPAYGTQGAILYDSDTALDLTNGSNGTNGGFSTIDFNTAPPAIHNPIAGATQWTFETWYKWTANISPPGIPVTFTGDVAAPNNYITNVNLNLLENGQLAVGDVVIGPNIPANTYITNLVPGFLAILLNQPVVGTGDNLVFQAFAGGIGATLFSTETSAGQIDVRAGLCIFDGYTFYNVICVGNVAGDVFSPVAHSNNAGTLDGNWHHLVIVYTSISVFIYIDSVLSNSPGSSTGAPWNHPSSITVGCDPGGVNGFPGSIDEVALYSEALNATQVSSHYRTAIWFQAQETAYGIGPTPRLKTICNVVGFPLSALYSPYNWVTELYGETTPTVTTSGLNYIQTMTETEPGLIFQGPNGALNAYNRQYQYLNPTSVTSQAAIGDNTSTGYHYDGPSLQIVGDDLDVWNDAQVQSGLPVTSLRFQREIGVLQEWGPTQSAAAAQSQSLYGSRTLQGLTALQMAYNSDALAIAQNYSVWYNFPLVRVVQMTLSSTGNGGINLTQMLQRDLYDRLTVQYQGQTAGPIFSQDSLIEQITHNVVFDGGPTWETVYSLSPYEILMTPFIFGDTAQSELAGPGFTPPQVLTL